MIEQHNKVYYFFIEDYINDSSNGVFYKLTLDMYNTYTRLFIDELKKRNPVVMFKRRHNKRLDDRGRIINHY